MPRDPRYLTCLTIPASLILASYLLRVRRPVRLGLFGAVFASSLAGAYLGQQSSVMEPQRTLLSQYSFRAERLWVMPQFAADLLIMNGMAAPRSVGIHLLEQGRLANGFRAAMLIEHNLRVVEAPAAGTSDVLAIRTQNQGRVPAGWEAFARIGPEPSALVRRVQHLLRAAGLGRFAGKLAPGGGESVVLFRSASRPGAP
jgi:hypothetical protein